MATAASSSRVAAVAEHDDKNEPARPLAIPHPYAHPAASDVDEAAQTATGWRSVQYLRKRRRCLLCCGGCCVATAVIVGILILALSLTVFKVKDPRLTMNGVSLAALRSGPGTGLADPVATNATLTADVSIENDHIASNIPDKNDHDSHEIGHEENFVRSLNHKSLQRYFGKIFW
ncbi:hypothetical protein TRIUR3_25281 [Triticum urartu]|uniref:Late embryogenesis abundant protein LEA-2 subgroup domain-containing protein n=1 Tax=Triticum urartu TaxID=4572 RepID=M7YTL1_TRIUA|nr:hypothetical protein TRIUR3_25281 [Triticum urartu]